MANTKDKPINKEDLRFILQRSETQLDSLTQKLQRRFGKIPQARLVVLSGITSSKFRKRVGYRWLPATIHCWFCNQITRLCWIYWMNYWARCSYCCINHGKVSEYNG